ncbi:MAG: hypothetical protein R2749_10695 [Acidimicrobiales bacterium]
MAEPARLSAAAQPAPVREAADEHTRQALREVGWSGEQVDEAAGGGAAREADPA